MKGRKKGSKNAERYVATTVRVTEAQFDRLCALAEKKRETLAYLYREAVDGLLARN